MLHEAAPAACGKCEPGLQFYKWSNDKDEEGDAEEKKANHSIHLALPAFSTQ